MLKTFRMGGIHPPENKISAKMPIVGLPVPDMVYIPASQNLGAPSTIIVKRGDKIKTGQLIAKGEAFISSNVHSSVSGTVQKVDDVLDTSGYRRKSVVIKVEGDDWEESIDRGDNIVREINLSREEIIGKIKEMGIVGLGGATFPAHIKLMIPKGRVANLLIINGVECEPYLTSDHQLMLEKGEEILIGTQILMKGLGVDKAVIGIENNKIDAIEHFEKLATGYPGISIQGLKVKYPQGGEKQLIKAITGREVPSGKLPIDIGCVVNNVGTAFSVYEAVQKNKPLFERVVTITGKSLKNPANFMVRVGTPLSLLVEKAGGNPEDTGKVVGGGPMMGKAIMSLDVPVVKGSSGILLLQENESSRVDVKNCIRCGKCVTVCPMGLEPYFLTIVSRIEAFEKAEDGNIMDCIECGSCHYVCPSGRPLLDYLRQGKISVGQIIRSRRR